MQDAFRARLWPNLILNQGFLHSEGPSSNAHGSDKDEVLLAKILSYDLPDLVLGA